MLFNKSICYGDINGVIYDFEKSGDILPEHTHDKSSVHITIVCKGSVKAYGNGWQKNVNAGQIINFKEDQPHEIMALEDNTRIINIAKHFGGTVNDYNKV